MSFSEQPLIIDLVNDLLESGVTVQATMSHLGDCHTAELVSMGMMDDGRVRMTGVIKLPDSWVEELEIDNWPEARWVEHLSLKKINNDWYVL